MKLKEYINNLIKNERWTAKECAAHLGISVPQMYLICRGGENVRIITAKKIQEATKKKVTMSDLVPENWQELASGKSNDDK